MKSITTHTKYAVILSIMLLLASTLVQHAYAQDAETPAVDPNTVQEERAEDRMERKEERQSKIAEVVQNRIVNLADNVVSRFNATAKRLENIMNRLDSRIVKLNAQGVDTTTAQDQLNKAKTSLGMANDQIANIPSVRDAIGSESPRETFARVRSQLFAIRDNLIASHKGLIDTVLLLKQAVQGAGSDQGASSAVTDTDTGVAEDAE